MRGESQNHFRPWRGLGTAREARNDILHNVTDLEQFWAAAMTDVDRALDELVPAADIRPTRLHEAIRWSLFAGGKRFRPVLVFAVGQVFGARRDRLVRTAAAFEMIHTYSLIHDDLPSMDDDDLRRGRLTCHKKFDEATAILAGDVLETLAFEAVARDDGLPAELRVRLIADLARAAGTPHGMVAGQQLDLEAEGKPAGIDDVDGIHRLKTGALIAACGHAGALIGEATDDEIAAIDRYSTKLGLLFQITDDLLDVTQTTEDLGKTANKDAAANKATYPSIFGVERSREMAAQLCSETIASLSPVSRTTNLLADIARYILDRGN